MPSPIDPTNPPSTKDDLDVRGARPLALAGRLVAIGRDGFVHSFNFDTGRVSYLARSVRTGAAVNELVVSGALTRRSRIIVDARARKGSSTTRQPRPPTCA